MFGFTNFQADKLTLYLPLPKLTLMCIFRNISLGIVVDGNIVNWVLKLNKELYGPKQASSNWLDMIKLV